MNIVWNPENNTKIQQRPWWWVSFEEIVNEIQNGRFIVVLNPKVEYVWQNMYIVIIGGYSYEIPYRILENGSIYLITAYPSRGAKKFIPLIIKNGYQGWFW